MRSLVTGCAGFIGSAVCHRLLADGHEVVGVDDLNDAYDGRLKVWRLERLRATKGFEFHQVDISRWDEIRPHFMTGRFDVVLNLAARAGVRRSIVDPWTYLEANAVGTLNVLELARRHDVPKVVLASTSSLYGSRNPRPFREDSETDHPLSPYAASKKAAESMMASYVHLHGIDGIVLRYFTVYGPAGRPDMSPFRFIRWIAEGEPIILYGDGGQERDFTYVDDIAEGTIAAVRLRGFDVINLGGDKPVTMMQLIRLIEAQTGRQAIIDHRPPHRADMRATWACIDRARERLGWAPRTPLEEGIRRSVAWYVENREWASRIGLGEA